MEIETLDDWNQRLLECGCCPMPWCPSPSSYVRESEQVSVETSGFITGPVPVDLGLWNISITKRFENTLTPLPPLIGSLAKVEYEGDPAVVFWDQTYPNRYKVIRCGAFVVPHLVVNTYGGSYTFTRKRYERASTSDPWTLVETTAIVTTKVGLDTAPTWERVEGGGAPVNIGYAAASNHPYCSTPVTVEVLEGTKTYEEWKTEAYAQLTFSDCYTSSVQSLSGITATTNIVTPAGSFTNASASRQKVRFRYRVPNTHLGNTYKLTYDIGEYPTVGAPFIFSADHVIEWTGPGAGAASDPSWLSPWSEPFESSSDTGGVRRVVNVRYTCYTSTRYGSKPQITGIGLAPP